MQKILEYGRWDDFVGVINKAKISCEASKQKVAYHFEEFLKMVKAGVSSVPTKDFKLTRYACYLIAQNADVKKKIVAFAQAYFSVQTRR